VYKYELTGHDGTLLPGGESDIGKAVVLADEVALSTDAFKNAPVLLIDEEDKG